MSMRATRLIFSLVMPLFARSSLCFLLILFWMSACRSPAAEEESAATEVRDLEHIIQHGTLRAILVYSSTSYFVYRGRTMGYEYELLQNFAGRMGLKLEIVLARDINELIPMLREGRGDLIAYGMTITEERAAQVNFTPYLYLTRQMLVQRKPAKADSVEVVRDPSRLIGDTITVRRNTAYFQRLENLQKEIGGPLHIRLVDGDWSTERIMEEVAEGRLRYTAADENIAGVMAMFYPQLDVATPLSVSQRIAWAVNKDSPDLEEALKEWIEEIRESSYHKIIYKKYFNDMQAYLRRARSPYMSLNEGRISVYDELIRRYSLQNGLDWRLTSALIYEESGFNPADSSWAGARGLMQIMPATAAELGIEDPSDPESSVRGGTRYLKQLYDMWKDIPDSTHRMQFALASYNCGYAHIYDAQRLAGRYGDDPLQWTGHVEHYLEKLSDPEYYNDSVVRYGYIRGSVPVNYVQNVLDRYTQYRNLIPHQ